MEDAERLERVGDGDFKYARRGRAYFIQFPHMPTECADMYGPLRWNEDRIVKDREWVSSTSLNWLMEAMLAIHGGISHPHDIVYALPAGEPAIQRDEKLVDMEPTFQPGAGRHAVIFRLVNMSNAHWLALVHFHTINSIVTFSPLAAGGPAEPAPSQDTRAVLESHARFVQGSAAARREPTSPVNLSIHDKGLLLDGWSCGLWCAGLARTLLELLSERRALDGEVVDCARLRDDLEKEIARDKIKPVTAAEAHQLMRQAWVSQQRPDNKFL